jgi:hypothetical protein
MQGVPACTRTCGMNMKEAFSNKHAPENSYIISFLEEIGLDRFPAFPFRRRIDQAANAVHEPFGENDTASLDDDSRNEGKTVALRFRAHDDSIHTFSDGNRVHAPPSFDRVNIIPGGLHVN